MPVGAERVGAFSYIDKIPEGVIMMWSGNLSNTPEGWSLCDGTNGTPDLTDKFVLSEGTRSIGATGGSDSVTLSTSEIPSHSHNNNTISVDSGGSHRHSYSAFIEAKLTTDTVSGNTSIEMDDDYDGAIQSGTFTTDATTTAGSHTHSGTNGSTTSTGGGGSHENRPEYHAIGYIQKD